MSEMNTLQPAVPAALKSTSNSKFLAWFLLLNAGIVLTLAWTGPEALFIPLLGFLGAFLSLFFAKWLAKRAHGIRSIDPLHPASPEQQALYEMVADLATRVGLKQAPEVGIYESADMNAFATGASQNSALVAVSSGLLVKMPPEQVRAVVAHEIAHIANRDMLGIVLLQGVINSIVIAATLPLNVLRLFNGASQERSWLVEIVLWAVKAVVALLLTFLGSLVVKAFSRHREYRADAFAAILLGKESMVNALKTLSIDTADIPIEQAAFASFKVSGRIKFGEFFSTHPLIEKRIAALEEERFTTG